MEIKLPEIIAIGIYNSNNVVKNKTVTSNRRTSMFEIEIPVENGGISYIDSDKMELRPDMVICAKPGQIRHTKLPFKCYYIHFILTEGDLYSKLINLPNYLNTRKYQEYFEIFQKMYNYYNTAINTDEIILQSLILELVYTLINDSKKQALNKQMKTCNYDTINKITAFIKNNLTSDLNLSSLSSIAGFSPTYFHKLFKSSTGKTAHEYIEDLRIKKAINMIVETDHTITQIAYECGFSSQRYFNYVFKRKMKITPKQYAKEAFEQYTKSIEGVYK